MMITHWCATCRQMQSASGVCSQCRGPLQPRITRDDPDDEKYGTPRCPTCWLEFKEGADSCSSCHPEGPA